MSMKVGYIEIPVSDMKRAMSFYEKLFGVSKLHASRIPTEANTGSIRCQISKQRYGTSEKRGQYGKHG